MRDFDEKFNPTLFYRFIWSDSVVFPILMSLIIWVVLAGGMVARELMVKTLASYRHSRNTTDAEWLIDQKHELNRRLDFNYKDYLGRVSQSEYGMYLRHIDRELLRPQLPDLFPFDVQNEDPRKQDIAAQAEQAYNNVMNHLARQG